MSVDAQQALIDAANFFNQAGRARLTTDNQFHPETLILAMARMAGSLMYRSFGLDESIAPGTTVLSEQANAYGPKLMNVMFAALHQLGDTISHDEIDDAYASATFSQLSFKASHDRLAPLFLVYCENTALGFHDAALGAAIATGIIVHDCRAVLPVDRGSALAIYGFVEGTKTAPYPLSTDAVPELPQTPARKRPWYKLW